MTPYFTSVKIPPYSLNLNFSSKLLFIGSCFADSIGSKFEALKFSSLVNPFGVLYNPYSVANALRYSLEKRSFTEADLFLQHGLYKSFDFHSQFSHSEAKQALQAMNTAVEQAHEQLKQAQVLFITFGTSWVYQLSENKQVVANCHKHPSSIFTRSRLSVNNIVSTWQELLNELRTFNPKLQVVFTVSPIRHWKDGAHGNQLSKATLLLAIDELIANNSWCEYFPSYEIVMDELRDYRFYADDMLHLSDLAINHIWQQVQESFIDKTCNASLKKIAKLGLAVQHRLFNASSEEAKQFVAANLKLITELEQECKALNFENEKDYFKTIIPN